jgi:hypothetical protein
MSTDEWHNKGSDLVGRKRAFERYRFVAQTQCGHDVNLKFSREAEESIELQQLVV